MSNLLILEKFTHHVIVLLKGDLEYVSYSGEIHNALERIGYISH